MIYRFTRYGASSDWTRGFDLRGRAHAKEQDFLFGRGMHFQHRTEGGIGPPLF